MRLNENLFRIIEIDEYCAWLGGVWQICGEFLEQRHLRGVIWLAVII
jgi:hypothetical protein